MLVRLTSSTSGEMIMFAEHAHLLFEIIGKESTARGVFAKAQLDDSIRKLKQAVHEEKLALQEAAQQAREAGSEHDEQEKNDEEHQAGRLGISLGQRATPLIHLMEWTLKEEGFILWEADKDF